MANFTTNYELKKPLQEEFYDVDDFNRNADIIDAELKKRAMLDENNKVRVEHIPDDVITNKSIGVAGGVAGLDENGKLKGNVIPNGVGGGGGSGKRTARFTVGSSQYGWTSSDCDYLCDGTADDVEINAAIQALRTTGGEVVLLDGLYNLASAIRINKDNVTLSGNGANTKIIRAFNDDEYGEAEGMVVITNSFCVVKNLYFDGVSATYASNNAINLCDGDNCIIADNTIVNSSVDGIFVDGDYHTVENNVITNCGNNGIYLYKGNKCVTVNNKIDNSGRIGMYIYRFSDSVISNNICLNSGGNGIDVYWSDHCTFTGNTLNDNNQSGLALTRGEGNIISANTFNGNGNYGVYLNSMSTDCAVMSNVFNNNTVGDVNDIGTNNKLDTNGKVYTATFSTSGWSGNSNGYKTQTVTVTGLKANYTVAPRYDVILSGTDPNGDVATLEGFACISMVNTGTNSMIAMCAESKPEVNVPIRMVVWE